MTKHCIMTVGLSHSGKTSLIENIIAMYPDQEYQHIETDTIRAMCHQYIPTIYHHNRGGGDVHIPSKYTNKLSLVARLQHTLLEYIMDHGKNITLSNGNTYKQGRQNICQFLRDHGYIVIMIYVSTDEKIILQRLEKNTSKDPALMLKSKSYQESYMKQKEVFEIPTPDEADFFIPYDGVDQSSVYNRLHSIITG